MQTITVVASAEHGLGAPTLAALAVTVVVVGLIAWQVAARLRALRHHQHLSHQGR